MSIVVNTIVIYLVKYVHETEDRSFLDAKTHGPNDNGELGPICGYANIYWSIE
jgi:hypothetical protein